VPKVTVIVEFEANEGCQDELAASLRDHARRTLHEEPGCLRFEVIQQTDEAGNPVANRLLVNELYANAAAFETHKANPRMPGLAAKNAPLLKSRRLITAISLDAEPEDEGLQPEELNAANDG
jgi:(4S)-4-hydroxy-5-phosphonooxypentane-2,3-dione isomerase